MIGTVNITVNADSSSGGGTVLTMNPNGTADILFQGTPGRSYLLQRSANMTGWSTLTTLVADAAGNISYTDLSPPQGSAFYRLGMP